MLCALILYVSGGNYSLTSIPNDRCLGNFFMAGLLLSEFLSEIAEEIFFFFSFRNHIFDLKHDLGFELVPYV